MSEPIKVKYRKPTPEQIERLPKLVQGHIERLERRVEQLEAVNQALAGEQDGPIMCATVVDHMAGLPPVRLERNTRVAFTEGSDLEGVQITYMGERKRGVRVSAIGSGTLKVQPLAMNCVQITTTD